MPDYIEYDENGKITNRWRSVDPSVVDGKQVLMIDRETYESLTKYKKVVDSQVVEMTQAEIDAIIAAEAKAAHDAAISQAESDVKDIIVALVKRINTRIPANPITKTEVIQQLKEDRGLV